MRIKEIRKRFTALGLALILALPSSVTVFAEETEEEVQEVLSEARASEEESEIEAKEELEIEAEEEPEIQTEGKAEIEAEEEPEIEEEELEIQAPEVTDKVNNAAIWESFTDPKLEIKDEKGDEKTIRILARNVWKDEAPEYFTLAVWSDDRGQDDLRWYEMSYSNQEDAFWADVPVNNHKSTGQYHVHLYFSDANRGMHFLLKDTFTIAGASAEKLEVLEINQDKGTAKVTISGVKSPSGVTSVSFPIWCKENQSDLVWYKGTKIAEGVYQVTLDISKHSYHYGTYQIHTYGDSGNGSSNFLLSTTCKISKGEVNLEAVQTNTGYTINARNLETANVKNIVFAIWSSANGQDDLKWITVNAATTGNASINWSPSETGEYIIHCYAKTSSGEMRFQKGNSVEVKGPKISEMKITADQKTGKFKILLQGIEGTQSISKIEVPVWSDPDQKDLVWYQAAKQSDGSYLVSGNISNHSYNLGTYTAHAYIKDTAGRMNIQLRDSFKMEASCGAVTAEDVSPEGEEYSEYLAKAEKVIVPGTAAKVEFAVWSDDKGQDDLKWYSASETSGTYSCKIRTVDHKSAGKYYVHCYANTKGGKKVFLGASEFSVDLSAKAEISLLEKNEESGKFTVRITLQEEKGTVDQLRVHAWVKEDKSDSHSYTAEKQEDNSWTCTIDAAEHGYHFGTYALQADVHFTSGLDLTAGETKISFAPKNFISVTKTEDGKRTLMISNVSSDAKAVTFPVWSDTNGQDDLVWYTAKKKSTGIWTADILAENLKHEGLAVIHCYVDDQFAGSTTATFTKEEVELRVGTKKVHQYAQEIIKATGGDLYKAYKWAVNSLTYIPMEIPLSYPSGYTRQEYYFTNAYETRKTNCFGFAASFYWVAKELGYDVTLKEARVRYRSGAYGPHGWVEIVIDGTTYICDPELEYEKNINSYMKTYANSQFSYQPDMSAY